MPNPELIGKTYYLRVRVPKDVASVAAGTLIAVPVSDKIVTTKVGDVVKLSLMTKDAATAKQRYTQALAAVTVHWEALRSGPTKLTHKQCVALAGEVRQVWVEALDDNPNSPELWERVKVLDAAAMQPKPHPYAELMVGDPTGQNNTTGLNERFGSFADAALLRRGLIVDTESRSRLLQLLALAMGEAVDVILKKSKGDYSDTGETTKYPQFEPPPPARVEPLETKPTQ